MVHELLGISNNRVDMSGVQGLSKEMHVSCSRYFFFYYLQLFSSVGGCYVI